MAKKAPLRKLLYLDIETRPATAQVWQLKTEYISPDMITDDGGLLCWGAYEQATKTYYARKYTDPDCWTLLYTLLERNDYMVGWNSSKYDWRKLKGYAILLDLPPVPPIAQLDLMTIARREFSWLSYKLDYAAQRLLNRSKVKHPGIDLWRRCLQDDPKAWAHMFRYMKQDVMLLPKLADKILPRTHGATPVLTTEPNTCVRCGGPIKANGHAYTAAYRYQRYICLDKKCGKTMRSTQRKELVAGMRSA